MTDKLTDKEIVKALECCASGDDGCEKDCPLSKECDSPIKSGEKIMQSAFDLINRLQAELKNNENIIRLADKTIETANAEIEEKDKNYIELLRTSSERAEIIGKQNAEIMRLQKLNDEILDRYDKCIDKYDSIVQKQSAENERLKPFKDKIAEFKSHIRVEDMLVFASSLEEWLEFCENLKAEAYKEFADKVKQEIDNIRRNAPSRHIGVVIKYLLCLQQKINNLLKELVGEKQMSDNKTAIEAYKEFAEKIIDKRINTAKYGEVVLLTDIYDTLRELGCEG